MAEETETTEPNSGPGTESEDERMVPLAALEATREKLHRAEAEAARYRGQAEAYQTNGNSPASQDNKKQEDFSPTQLRQAVEQGTISEDEADAIRERQIERRVEARLSTSFQQQNTQRGVAAEIQRYKEAIPALNDPDSKEFGKLKSEFVKLVEMGYDAKDVKTEYAAARAAFGDPTKRSSLKADPPNPHQETGGSAASEADGRTSDGAPKGLTARQRDYYRTMIDKGMYRGWDDPGLKAELKYTDTPVARRAQARAAA